MSGEWQRLGQLVSQRRGKLRLSQKDLADTVSVSVKTISTLESGRASGMRAVTIAALEDALGWCAGDVRVVLDGGEPQLRAEAKPAGPGLDAAVEGFSLEEIDIVHAVIRVIRLAGRRYG